MPRNPPRPRYAAGRPGDHAVYRRRRRRWPWITLGCMVLIIGALSAVGFVFAKQAMSVRDDLTAAKEDLKSITGLVKAGDTKAMEAVAHRALEKTTHAEATVHGPLWDIAANIPFVGQNISAVQDATEATGILVRDAVPVGVKMLTVVNPASLKLEGGGFNLAPFADVQKDLPEINDAFTRAHEKVSGIDRKELLPFVDGSIGQLLTVIDEATPTLKTLEEVLPSVLDVAGAHGSRTYLVIFQNNAESRATGGNPAASALMKVKNGHVEMLGQSSSSDFDDATGTSKLPKGALALYEGDTARKLQNFTRTPNFPTTAQMFSGLWAERADTHLDGVISIDPVVLSYMLKVTGPVTASDGTVINSDNAVDELLQKAYVRFKDHIQASDVFYADVAAKVFGKLTGGGWNPMDMVDALKQSAQEQRLYMWFKRAPEQAISVKLGVSGTMLTDNKTNTEVGIFVNDSGYGKLEYWLSDKVSVRCDAAAGTVTTSITLKSTVPTSGLTMYQINQRNIQEHVAPSTMLLDVLYFAPPGSTILSNKPADGDVKKWTRTNTEGGRDAKSITVALKRGETRTVTYTSTLPSGPRGPISLRHTPTVTSTPVTIAPSCLAASGR